MNRLLDRFFNWLFEHAVASWLIPALSFVCVGSLLVRFYGFTPLSLTCLGFGMICGAMAYDAYEDTEG